MSWSCSASCCASAISPWRISSSCSPPAQAAAVLYVGQARQGGGNMPSVAQPAPVRWCRPRFGVQGPQNLFSSSQVLAKQQWPPCRHRAWQHGATGGLVELEAQLSKRCQRGHVRQYLGEVGLERLRSRCSAFRSILDALGGGFVQGRRLRGQQVGFLESTSRARLAVPCWGLRGRFRFEVTVASALAV